ncbi:hypothetical protein [Flavobacterium caseinilyticum]|uniref:Porin n=1 Tax=Flavobacterium caseinilyticum TaxID=2541732 RepID=A0A4V2YUG1_9FLAO|nr:hypothetical protein E0F89_07005 [Flavobacterium caseinilyticum]
MPLDRYVGFSKFLYAVQLSFAPGDVSQIKEGKNINIIRDAVFFYRPNKNWNISFGQTKLPGNRQRVNSSGGFQSELTFDTLNYFEGSTENNWYLRFQVEIGI